MPAPHAGNMNVQHGICYGRYGGYEEQWTTKSGHKTLLVLVDAESAYTLLKHKAGPLCGLVLALLTEYMCTSYEFEEVFHITAFP